MVCLLARNLSQLPSPLPPSLILPPVAPAPAPAVRPFTRVHRHVSCSSRVDEELFDKTLKITSTVTIKTGRR